MDEATTPESSSGKPPTWRRVSGMVVGPALGEKLAHWVEQAAEEAKKFPRWALGVAAAVILVVIGTLVYTQLIQGSSPAKVAQPAPVTAGASNDSSGSGSSGGGSSSTGSSSSVTATTVAPTSSTPATTAKGGAKASDTASTKHSARRSAHRVRAAHGQLDADKTVHHDAGHRSSGQRKRTVHTHRTRTHTDHHREV
jgi:hypothetical protein